MSQPPNSSHEGRTSKDVILWHAHAPLSAPTIHGKRARQRIAGIGHPLSLRFQLRITKDRGGLLCPSPEPVD